MELTDKQVEAMIESKNEILINLAKENRPDMFRDTWEQYSKSDVRVRDKGSLYGTNLDMYDLMMDIQVFTEWANKQDGYIIDWDNQQQAKFYIWIPSNSLQKGFTFGCRMGLFQCYFATSERAKQCIEIFGDRLKEVFEL